MHFTLLTATSLFLAVSAQGTSINMPSISVPTIVPTPNILSTSSLIPFFPFHLTSTPTSAPPSLASIAPITSALNITTTTSSGRNGTRTKSGGGSGATGRGRTQPGATSTAQTGDGNFVRGPAPIAIGSLLVAGALSFLVFT